MKRDCIKTFLSALLTGFVIGVLAIAMLQGSAAQAQTARRRPTSTAIVPVGTELKVRLRNTLSSKTSRAGDRFTATVVDPNRYDGAIARGHIRSISKSGRVSGRTTMTLAFDSITLSGGRRGLMRAEVVQVYDSDKSTSVDEEGRIQSGSRGNQTLKRTGIGAVAGAVVGGVVGGGKGAVIGGAVGGGAGAGSVAVGGSRELKIEQATEILIRVTRR